MVYTYVYSSFYTSILSIISLTYSVYWASSAAVTPDMAL